MLCMRMYRRQPNWSQSSIIWIRMCTILGNACKIDKWKPMTFIDFRPQKPVHKTLPGDLRTWMYDQWRGPYILASSIPEVWYNVVQYGVLCVVWYGVVCGMALIKINSLYSIPSFHSIVFHHLGQTQLICCFLDLSQTHLKGSRGIKIKINGKISKCLDENTIIWEKDSIFLKLFSVSHFMNIQEDPRNNKSIESGLMILYFTCAQPGKNRPKVQMWERSCLCHPLLGCGFDPFYWNLTPCALVIDLWVLDFNF